MAARRTKVSILSFEVASTIRRCSKLLHSVSRENIQFLKTEILHSQGIEYLVSSDMEELLGIAAADKREELNSLICEVNRYGDMCKDVQWRNLRRFFSGLVPDPTNYKNLKEEAEMSVIILDAPAQATSELYHQLCALSRFEQDYYYYLEKLNESETSRVSRKGKSLIALQSELRHQTDLVRSLKKKSLWFLGLEEVVKDLLNIIMFINEELYQTFEDKGRRALASAGDPIIEQEKLGIIGLDLHYANIIILINNIASRSASLSANMRNTLYQWLPNSIKAQLPNKLGTDAGIEALTIPQIKDRLDKTLRWLVPLALNTIKTHHGFRQTRIKESIESNVKDHDNIIRLQTLYHVDKMKMEPYIIELVVWLHYLIYEVIGSSSWSTGTAMIEEYS